MFKSITLIGTICGLAFASGDLFLQNKNDKVAALNEAFNAWVTANGRTYTDAKEADRRKQNFKRNWDFVNKHDSKKEGFTVALNKFADWTDREFKDLLTYRPNNSAKRGKNPGKKTVPKITDSLDWREFDAVSDVLDQGRCGAGYAFAAVDALEFLHFNRTGTFQDISPQQAIDCSRSSGNRGCRGGNAESVFRYFQSQQAQNISTYAYTGTENTCSASSGLGVFSNSGFEYVFPKDVASMLEAVKRQPLVVGISADKPQFMLYSSGIIQSKNCGNSINHAVLLIGYGEESGTPFWIVKNSWGTGWGESGYARILMDTKQGGNGICGINQDVLYPILV